MGCPTKLDLANNGLTDLDEGTFQGLTNSLQDLDLHYNEIEILHAGAFVGVPKFNLSLQENSIRKIKRGAFICRI